jgi:glycosyltransferase involved in cell wall biosynthesis
MLPALKREVKTRSIFNEFRAFFSLYTTLREIKRRHPSAIVHTHSTKAGILGRWAAWAAGITHRIHTVHGFALHEHQSWTSWILVWLCEQLTLGVTTRFVCVSERDRALGSRLFWGFNQRATLIRAAVEDRLFIPTQRAPQPETFTIGTVSCFKPQKNLIDLIDAFAEVYARNTGARLEIVGDGTERSRIENRIIEHGLIDVVTLHGWRHDVPEIMAHWDCFALSSLWEGLPCAVVEARLMKLPVVAYATGGIPEVIQDGVNGYLIPQKNRHLLAERLHALSVERELCRKLAHYHDTLDAFSAHSMHQAHREIYDLRSP